MAFPNLTQKIAVIAGHYGCGKTNIAINLALRLSKSGKKVSIVDLDIINPYFRTADSEQLLTQNGVDAILPEFANTNVEIPTLPVRFRSVFTNDGYAVLDVGGDDSGAIVLGGYAEEINACGYEMFYVYNRYRMAVAETTDAYAMMLAIEAVSGLKFTGIINNSNIAYSTTPEIILDSIEYTDRLSELSGVPTIAMTIHESLMGNPELSEIKHPVVFIEDVTKKLF